MPHWVGGGGAWVCVCGYSALFFVLCKAVEDGLELNKIQDPVLHWVQVALSDRYHMQRTVPGPS